MEKVENKNRDKGCKNAELRQMDPKSKDNGGAIGVENQKKDYSNNKKATYL